MAEVAELPELEPAESEEFEQVPPGSSVEMSIAVGVIAAGQVVAEQVVVEPVVAEPVVAELGRVLVLVENTGRSFDDRHGTHPVQQRHIQLERVVAAAQY